MLDFGFGFWVLFFVIFFGCGRMCGWGARRYRARRRDLEAGEGVDDSDRLSRLESRLRGRERRRLRDPQPELMSSTSEAAEPQHSRSREPRATPLKELQQKFVEGRLTLSEYERELDRLERLE